MPGLEMKCPHNVQVRRLNVLLLEDCKSEFKKKYLSRKMQFIY